MQIPLLTQYSNSLKETILQVENQLYKGAKNRYHIDLYAVNLSWSVPYYKDLIRWKRILSRRSFNAQYLSCLSHQDLLTAVKTTLSS